jgi:hypothetical protein
VVVTDDGRADFELLSRRVNGRNRRPPAEYPIALHVFDLLRHDRRDLCDQPWIARRNLLYQFDQASATMGVAGTVWFTDNGQAMHKGNLGRRGRGDHRQEDAPEKRRLSRRRVAAVQPVSSRRSDRCRLRSAQRIEHAAHRRPYGCATNHGGG